MPVNPRETVYYKRARFTSRLPSDCIYTPGHYWLRAEEEDIYRVGLTKFATRMLGDFVECNFQAEVGSRVQVGEMVGSLEGFKAISEIYCVVDGEFLGSNRKLDENPSLVDNDPYDNGWLYQVRGRPAENVLDVAGYVATLDATIDKMLSDQRAAEDRKC